MTYGPNFATTNSYIVFYLEAIQNSQNYGANTSNVTVRAWVKRTNSGYTTYGTGRIYVTVDGAQYSDSLTTSDRITSTPLKIFERTVNIAHNADGTKTIPFVTRIEHSVFSSGNLSWSMALGTIPRASKPTLSAKTVNYGSAVTIYTNRASGSFTHTLRYAWNGVSGTIANNVATSQSWTVPLTLMNNIPNATSSWGTIYCDTYNGSTKIGTTQVTLNTNVPTTIVPTFSTITHSENTSNVKTLIGAYVQGLSKLNLAITGAAGSYSSTIKKYEITFEGTTYTASSAVSNLIKGSGTLTVTGKITDSRGRTATKSVSVSVLAYAPPKITSFKPQRATSSGTLADLGVYSQTLRAATWNTLNSKNKATIRIYSKARNETTWVLKHTLADQTSGSISGSVLISGYVATQSFDFRLDVSDAFNTTISMATLPTGGVTMSWAPEGIGVGKIWERGALDVAGDVHVSNGRIFGGLGATLIPANANLNNYLTEGLYYNPSNADVTTIVNTPRNYAFSLLVERHAGIRQTFTTYYADGWESFSRNTYNGVWGGWVRNEYVREAGSNSNGNYIKYGEGLMICYMEKTLSLAISNIYNNGSTGLALWQNTWRWTFPVVFSAVPTVQCSDFRWGTSATWGRVSAKATNYADIGLMDVISRGAGNCTVSAMAIGRWY